METVCVKAVVPLRIVRIKNFFKSKEAHKYVSLSITFIK